MFPPNTGLAANAGPPHGQPISERLRQRKQDLEQELARVDKALELLNQNDGISEILDAISELSY